jgi:hypothetical protein
MDTGTRVSDLGHGRTRKVPPMSPPAWLLRVARPGSPRSLPLLAPMPPSCYRRIIPMPTKIDAAWRQRRRLRACSQYRMCRPSGGNRECLPEGSISWGDDRRRERDGRPLLGGKGDCAGQTTNSIIDWCAERPRAWQILRGAFQGTDERSVARKDAARIELRIRPLKVNQ